MSIKEEILNYIPFNEQEKKDKEFIINCINKFNNIFLRENEIVHFTSSGFVVNKNRDKVLMIYHNIYNSWGWTGGHSDGDENLLDVAIKEVKEETSIKNLKVLNNGNITSIDTLPVAGHFKKGKYVNAHIHLSVAYIFEADESENIKIKPDENSNIAWQDINKVVELSTEPHMKLVYKKIIDKLNQNK